MTLGSTLEFIKRSYASADPRSLGAFRIVLGLVLFFDVLRRVPWIETHYSNAGWLTNHFMLFRPMSEHLLSIYLAFSTPDEVSFLMGLHLVICFLFTIGWRTRLMHVLAAFLLVSVNSRNIMLENGGWVALTVLTIWTMFLPLGARFSIDAVRASLRLRRENGAEALNDRNDPPRPTAPVVSLAVFALLAQWIVIYAFNVLQKTGPEWKDGTAVYYLFHQDRVISGLAAWARSFLTLGAYQTLTYSGLAIEAAIAILLASPFWTERARLVAWLLAIVLHGSIAMVVDLGPFSWAMMAAFVVFVPASVWERWSPRLAARFPRHELGFSGASGFWITVCRVVKRFDVLDRVRFVPLPAVAGAAQAAAPVATADERREDGEKPDGLDEDDEDDEDDEEDEEANDADEGAEGEGAAKSFVVTNVRGERFTGIDAVFALSRSIPGGALLALPLRLPGVHGSVNRRLLEASKHPARYDEYFELESLTKEPERRPPEPTPARLSFARSLAVARESLVVLLLVCSGFQLMLENPVIPAGMKPPRQPVWMRAVVVYPRMFQGWSMFAPSPTREDSRLVVDGVTNEGLRLDPLTGVAPKFEVAPNEARRMNQLWGEFHRRVGTARFQPYLEGLKDFIRRHHDITGRRHEKLVAFEAWVVTEVIPAPGQPRKPPTRKLLFSEGAMPERQASPPGEPSH